MTNWRELTVADLAQPDGVVGGPFGSELVRSDYRPCGVPVIRGCNLSKGKHRFDATDLVFVDELKADALSRNLALPGDVVVTQRGTLGQVGVVPQQPIFSRWVISQSQMRIRCDPKVADPLFVYYWLLSADTRNYIEANAVAAGVPHINLGFLRSMRLLVPTVGEQRAISRVLSALDDKIDLNRRMNVTLEEMAQALFKSWFVDFDPVRARAAGRSPAAMDAETVNLFPREFVESELGPIPQGWRVDRVGGFVDLQRGSTYKSSLKGEQGPYLLGLASIRRNGGFRGDKLVRYGGASPSKMLLRPGDLYVSLKDVTQAGDLLGAVARVPSYVDQGRLTQDTVKLDLRGETAAAHFLYRALLTLEYREHCRAHATGTTNLGLSREDFLGYPFAVPDGELINCFNAHADAFERRIEAATEESSTLARIRDALLPRLLSGELRVRDAERAVEKVA